MKRPIILAIWIISVGPFLKAQDSIAISQKLSLQTQYKRPAKYFLGVAEISYDSFKTTLLSSSKSELEMLKAIRLRNRARKILVPVTVLVIPTFALGLASKLNGYKKSWYDTTFVTLSIPTIPLIFYMLYSSNRGRYHMRQAMLKYNNP